MYMSLEPISPAGLRAILRQEIKCRANVKMYVERMHKLKGSNGTWTINREVEWLDKQLTSELTRLNKINRILIDHGHRLEE